MREIVLDTETTGLDPATGHRIVEIACIELINRLPSDQHFQRYLNPECEMPEEAFAVHGLSNEFLAGQPRFADVAEDFLAFIEDAPLVIHNSEFDIGFLNAELARVGRPAIPLERAIDTVALARRRFPGAQASLDALCKRFEIDLSERTLHGALLDCRLLAAVYLELSGGRQPDLSLDPRARDRAGAVRAARAPRPPRPHAPSAEEEAAHAKLLALIQDPIWSKS